MRYKFLQSIRTKVGLLVISAAIFPILLIFFILSQQVNLTLANQRKREVEKVSDYLDKTLKGVENKAVTYSEFLTSTPEIQDAATFAVNTKDRKGLLDVINQYYKKIGLSILNIIDKQGKVLVRAEMPEDYGDDKSNKSYIQKGLNGQTVLGFEKGMRGYGIRAASPLKTAEGIIGVIETGELLNNNFAKSVSKTTLSETAFFYGDELIASSFLGETQNEQALAKKLKEIVGAKKEEVIAIGGEPFYFSSFSYSIGNMQMPIKIALGISVKHIIDSQKRMSLTLGIILVVVGILAVIFGYIFALGLTNPLIRLRNFAQSLGGDLTKKIELKSQDETGKLAGSFNEMIESLNNVVSEVKKSSEKVNNVAQGLSSSAQEMNASTQSISTTIQQLTKGIVTQAKRTEETAGIMEKMADSVNQVGVNANEGLKASQETTVLAKQGMEISLQAVEMTSRVSDVTNKIAGSIEQLGSRSQEIGRIVEVITNIADQTNLLALNAAIEAARAGEAGRGFAVVAEEVRKLAENSAKAADQITKLIRTIQQETSKAVDSAKITSKEVEGGRVVIERVRQFLDKILKSAQQTAAQVEEITFAAKTQLTNTQDVSKAVGEVAAIAEESAASTEEVSSSTEEMTASMQEMTSTAQELVTMAAGLQELVQKFRVKG